MRYPDYVYYLVVDGELQEDLVFESEEAALTFAKMQGYEKVRIEVEEWDVS